MMTKDEFKKAREAFFDTTFLLLGHIANCDGYINREELARTRRYMEKMQLTEHCKRQAVFLFKTGSNPQFNMAEALEKFKDAVAKSPSIIEVLLVYLISVARVDGSLVEKELKLIKRVASLLGYSSIIFEHLLRMITAQEKVYSSQGTYQNSKSSQNSEGKKKNKASDKPEMNSSDTLESAYHALGMQVGDKANVKKTYRKLVNQYHPDKIQGQGLPPEFLNAATEYFKRIHTAYEYIINSHLKY